jgi:ABC-type bacteriocin/lantibiotic exporter with double-glycine peptidase domain
VGELFGLRGRTVSLEIDALCLINPGAILFWEFRHFVVFERADSRGVALVDPLLGKRRIPLSECRRKFTGVALLFEPAGTLERGKRRRSRIWTYLRRITAHHGLLLKILSTSAILQLFGLGLPILTGTVVDRVVPYGDWDLLFVIGTGLGLIAACYCLTSAIRSALLLHLRTALDVELTFDFIDHLVRLPYAFFQQRSIGDLMLRLNSNATVREILTAERLSSVDGILVFSYLIVLWLISPRWRRWCWGWGAL